MNLYELSLQSALSTDLSTHALQHWLLLLLLKYCCFLQLYKHQLNGFIYSLQLQKKYMPNVEDRKTQKNESSEKVIIILWLINNHYYILGYGFPTNLLL